MIRDCPNCRYHPTRPGGNLCNHPEQGRRYFWAEIGDGCSWFEPSEQAKGHEQIPLFQADDQPKEETA